MAKTLLKQEMNSIMAKKQLQTRQLYKLIYPICIDLLQNFEPNANITINHSMVNYNLSTNNPTFT